MKLNKIILLSLALGVTSGAALSSCSEEKTLAGADAVYIDVTPSEFNLAYGDTVPFTYEVTNRSGAPITDAGEPKITFADEGVARMVERVAAVDTVNHVTTMEKCLVAVPFDNLDDQIKQTDMRVELKNGMYRLVKVSVTRGTPKGILPVDTANVYMPEKISYMNPHDTVVFRVEPREVLHDFTPTFEIDGDGLLAPYEVEPMRVDREQGTVTIHFSAARKAGEGRITVAVGGGESKMSASCRIKLLPPIEGATFYGPAFAGMPYIESRPPCHTLRQYYANAYNKTLDLDSYDTVRVAVNVQTGAIEDIREALDTYRWETVEGTACRITSMYEEIFEGAGFDAVIVVKSGRKEGSATFQCLTSTDTLTASYTVYDYQNRFPVTRVYTDSTEVNMVAGTTSILTTFVEPMSSYGYQKPVVTSADPTIAAVGQYEGNQIPIRGLKPGQTELIVTSYGLETRVPVYVVEGVTSAVFDPKRCPIAILQGQQVDWTLIVHTPNGTPSTYPVNWMLSDETIARVEQNPDDVNMAILTGLRSGKAALGATVLDKTAAEREFTVVPFSPEGMTLRTDDFLDDDTGLLDADGNLQLQLCYNPGMTYSTANVIIPGFMADGRNPLGRIELTEADGAYFELNGARADIARGYISVADNDDGYVTVDMDLELNVRGLGAVHITAAGLVIGNWLE